MRNAEETFVANIRRAKEQSALYSYLVSTVAVPLNLDDILRAQIVYAVSAFDKLMHDIIRIGMVETFGGLRAATAKYKSETISLDMHGALLAASVPPPEIIFESEVMRKLGFLSFQDPDKIAAGLALVWDEQDKWQKVSSVIHIPANDIRKRLKLISVRRNAIVHEADMHPLTHAFTPIDLPMVTDLTEFLEICGRSIVGLICRP